MPLFTYIAKKQLRIGDSVRQPGELVPECVEWPNRDLYIDQGYLEAIPDLTENEKQHAVYRPSPSPRTYAPAGPERPPTPVREAGRFPGPEGSPEQQSVRCRNCREVSWLDASLTDGVMFSCWRCSQAQTIQAAREASSPIGIEEWSGSLDARRPVVHER
jgi:hypothetical protein